MPDKLPVRENPAERLVGGTFYKGAFDQQIFVNRESMDEDSRLSSAFASNAGFPANCKNGVAGDQKADDSWTAAKRKLSKKLERNSK